MPSVLTDYGYLCLCLCRLDYQLAESYNLQLDYSDKTSDYRDTNFPARYIYERLLPEIVNEHSNIHYHPSSPYSGFGQKTTDQTHGDLHQCTCNSTSRPKTSTFSQASLTPTPHHCTLAYDHMR